MAIFDITSGRELSEEERIFYRRRQIERSRKAHPKKKVVERDPQNVTRGILVSKRIRGAELENDILVQGRVAAQDLATAVKALTQRGDIASIKSYSALIQASIEFLGKSLATEGEIIEDYEEALDILERSGLLKPTTRRASGGAIHRNRQRLERQQHYRDEIQKEEREIELPKKPYTMSEEEIRIFNMNAKLLNPNQNTFLPEPKSYEPEEGEYDNLRGTPERIMTEEEIEELKQFAADMEENKKRNLFIGRKNKAQIDEDNEINKELEKRQQSLMRRGLLQ